MRPARAVLVGPLLLLGVVIAGVLGFIPRLRAPRRPLPNVVLIVLDTLRADRLGVYDPGRRLTPFLDRLAAGSLVYERAYAPASWTVPSVASMFLGQFASEHQVVVMNAVLPEDMVTLAEVLRRHGFATGGFSANFQLSAESGFAQGFDHFHAMFDTPKGDAAQLNRDALGWLDAIGVERRPFFLYLQYMEPHSPYRFHQGVTVERAPELDIDDAALAKRVSDGAWFLREGEPPPVDWRFTPAEVRRLLELYDGEVASLDRSLRDLFAELERRGVLEHALVIVTADHGEEFGEHGPFAHGVTLFEAAIHVPLIVLLPGSAPSRRIATPVTLAGLAPAIFRELGIDAPASFHVPAIPREPVVGTAGYAYSESFKEDPKIVRVHRRAVVSESAKLLVELGGAHVFYDLGSDPGETRPLAAPAFAADLRQALSRFTSDLVAPAGPEIGPADPATRERLRALGYAN